MPIRGDFSSPPGLSGHGAMTIVIGPDAPVCTYTTELAATGIICRVAAGSETGLDMLGEEEYCIGVGTLQSNVNETVPWPGLSVQTFPTNKTPPPQASLYEYGVDGCRPEM